MHGQEIVAEISTAEGTRTKTALGQFYYGACSTCTIYFMYQHTIEENLMLLEQFAHCRFYTNCEYGS